MSRNIYVSCASIAEVLDKTLADKNSVGVIPIENTYGGEVIGFFDLLAGCDPISQNDTLNFLGGWNIGIKEGK